MLTGTLTGYSYLSNEYGLSLDNVVAFELVMPNGTVGNITSSSDPDLFFGLRVSSWTCRSRTVLIFFSVLRGDSTTLYVTLLRFQPCVRHADALQGIVTTVTLKTHHLSQVWVSIAAFSWH
jgi:hypothetical protein